MQVIHQKTSAFCPFLPMYSNFLENGLGMTLFNSLIKHEDKMALMEINAPDGDSYYSLLCLSKSIMAALIHFNINEESTVVICSRNSTPTIVCYLAALFLNIKVCVINKKLNKLLLKEILEEMCPAIIFTNDRLVTYFQSFIGDETMLVTFGQNETCRLYVELLEFDYEEVEPVGVRDLNEVALIYFTGGTTDYPSKVNLTHHTILTQIFYLITTGINFTINFTSAPYSHICSTLCLFASIVTGSLHIVCRKFKRDEFIGILKQNTVTASIFYGFDAVLLLYPKSDPIVTDMSEFLVTGSPISEEEMWSLRALFPKTKVFQCYSFTQAGGFVTTFDVKNDFEYLHNNPSSCGKLLRGFWCKVVDPNTEEELPEDQMGELILTGASFSKKIKKYYPQFRGYWMNSGDLGYCQNRYIKLCDINETVYRVRSVFVGSKLIEKIILSHPDVEDVLVCPVPDDVDRNHTFALVALKEGSEEVKATTILKYTDHLLERHQRLTAGIKIVNHIPQSGGGCRRKAVCEMIHEKKI